MRLLVQYEKYKSRNRLREEQKERDTRVCRVSSRETQRDRHSLHPSIHNRGGGGDSLERGPKEI